MKKFFVIAFFISALCGFASAQDSFPELDVAKEIKLLRSTESDVKAIMSEFDRDEDKEDEIDKYDDIMSVILGSFKN